MTGWLDAGEGLVDGVSGGKLELATSGTFTGGFVAVSTGTVSTAGTTVGSGAVTTSAAGSGSTGTGSCCNEGATTDGIAGDAVDSSLGHVGGFVFLSCGGLMAAACVLGLSISPRPA